MCVCVRCIHTTMVCVCVCALYTHEGVCLCVCTLSSRHRVIISDIFSFQVWFGSNVRVYEFI